MYPTTRIHYSSCPSWVEKCSVVPKSERVWKAPRIPVFQGMAMRMQEYTVHAYYAVALKRIINVLLSQTYLDFFGCGCRWNSQPHYPYINICQKLPFFYPKIGQPVSVFNSECPNYLSFVTSKEADASQCKCKYQRIWDVNGLLILSHNIGGRPPQYDIKKMHLNNSNTELDDVSKDLIKVRGHILGHRESMFCATPSADFIRPR